MMSFQIEHQNHEIYFQIACEQISYAKSIFQEITESNKIVVFADKYVFGDNITDTNAWLQSKLFLLKKSVVSSIIFSALTVEAFINYYAILNGISMKRLKKIGIAKNYVYELLDAEEIKKQYQLPVKYRTTIRNWKQVNNSEGVCFSGTVRKWVELPMLVTGRYIPSGLDGGRIYSLNALFSVRNSLVHHKATIATLNLEDPDFEKVQDKNYVNLSDAQNFLKLVIQLLEALKYIDSNIDIEWINENCG
jgi:hypothetical protein